MARLRRKTARSASAANIRTVEAGDAERIRRILQVAFEDENRRMGQQESRLPTIQDRLLAFYLDRCPEASFVAEGKGGIIGFCLACRWGTTGWLGPIAVLPPAQGGGLGRRLIAASTSVLRDRGVTTLGIETMPRSYRNLQLYSRLGMNFVGMTLDMTRRYKPNESGSRDIGGDDRLSFHSLAELTGDGRSRLLESVEVISGRAAPGLDYRQEVLKTEEHGLGDTLLMSWEEDPIGFAVVHSAPYAREELHGTARVNTLLIALDGEEEDEQGLLMLDHLVGHIESWMRSRDLNAMTIRVPTWQPGARNALLRRGFVITHSDVRMTYEGLDDPHHPGAVHLSKWE